MNGYANNHFAEKMAAARRRETERSIALRLPLPSALDVHPMRAWLAQTLIRLGTAVAPQQMELAPTGRTSQPC